MLAIERTTKAQAPFTVRGRMQPEDIDQGKQLRHAVPPWQRLPLDLQDLAVVKQEPVIFLVTREANAIRPQATSANLRESAK